MRTEEAILDKNSTYFLFFVIFSDEESQNSSWTDSFITEISNKEETNQQTNPKQIIPQFDGNFDSDLPSSSDDFKSATSNQKKKNKKPSQSQQSQLLTPSMKKDCIIVSETSSMVSIPVASTGFTKTRHNRQAKRKAPLEQRYYPKRKRSQPQAFFVNKEQCSSSSNSDSINRCVCKTSACNSCPCSKRREELAEFFREIYNVRECKVLLTDIQNCVSKDNKMIHGNCKVVEDSSKRTPEQIRKPKLRMKFKRNRTGNFYIKNSPQTPPVFSKQPELCSTATSQLNSDTVSHEEHEIVHEDLTFLTKKCETDFEDALYHLSFRSPVKNSSLVDNDSLPECFPLSPCYSDISEEFALPHGPIHEISESPTRCPTPEVDVLPELSTYGSPVKELERPTPRRLLHDLNVGRTLFNQTEPEACKEPSFVQNTETPPTFSNLTNDTLSTTVVFETPIDDDVVEPNHAIFENELVCDTVPRPLQHHAKTRATNNSVELNEAYTKKTLSYSFDSNTTDTGNSSASRDFTNHQNEIAASKKPINNFPVRSQEDNVSEKVVLPKDDNLSNNSNSNKKLINDETNAAPSFNRDHSVETDLSIAPIEKQHKPVCTFLIRFDSDDSSVSKSTKSESLDKEKVETPEDDTTTPIDTDHHQRESDLFSPLMYDKTSFIFGSAGDPQSKDAADDYDSTTVSNSNGRRETNLEDEAVPRFVLSQEYDTIKSFQPQHMQSSGSSSHDQTSMNTSPQQSLQPSPEPSPQLISGEEVVAPISNVQTSPRQRTPQITEDKSVKPDIELPEYESILNNFHLQQQFQSTANQDAAESPSTSDTIQQLRPLGPQLLESALANYDGEITSPVIQSPPTPPQQQESTHSHSSKQITSSLIATPPYCGNMQIDPLQPVTSPQESGNVVTCTSSRYEDQQAHPCFIATPPQHSPSQGYHNINPSSSNIDLVSPEYEMVRSSFTYRFAQQNKNTNNWPNNRLFGQLLQNEATRICEQKQQQLPQDHNQEDSLLNPDQIQPRFAFSPEYQIIRNFQGYQEGIDGGDGDHSNDKDNSGYPSEHAQRSIETAGDNGDDDDDDDVIAVQNNLLNLGNPVSIRKLIGPIKSSKENSGVDAGAKEKSLGSQDCVEPVKPNLKGSDDKGLIILRPGVEPPSIQQVRATLSQHQLPETHNQGPYFSEDRDLQDKTRYIFILLDAHVQYLLHLLFRVNNTLDGRFFGHSSTWLLVQYLLFNIVDVRTIFRLG